MAEEKETKNKRKNRRLSVQMGLMTLLFFLGTLCVSLPMILTIIRRSYLKAKEESFDLHLKAIRDDVVLNARHTSWLLSYMREKPEDFRRQLTDKEIELRNSKDYIDELEDFIQDGNMDPNGLPPEKQLLFARDLLQQIRTNIGVKQNTVAADILLLDFSDDEVFIYLHDAWKKEEYENATVIPLTEDGHSALEELRSADGTDPDKTYYEIAESKGISCYIGYLPVYFGDGSGCTICIMYDWSNYHDLTVKRLAVFTAAGVLVLIVLNILMMIIIYRKVIKPVETIKEGIVEYKDNKDAQVVSDKMDTIQTRNEIGVLAESFSEMATEVERYTLENLKLSAEQERINTELALAASIQSSVLPAAFPTFPDRNDFDLYASMNPAKEVGGDFYDFFLIDEDHICLVIADVSGKGIPAALFMMSSKIVLKNNAMHEMSPAKIMTMANKAICATNKEMLFVTVWLGVLELSTGKLKAVNAGHEPVVIKGEKGSFELIEYPHDVFAGVMDAYEFSEYEMTLKPGDKIFLYTDGVPEATNSEGELFGFDRMIDALNTAVEAAPEEILNTVHKSVDAFVKEAEQFDDLTMMCLEYRGPEAGQTRETRKTSRR